MLSITQGKDQQQKLSELHASKIAFLEEAGLLQQGAADRTEFVLTRGKPLTDELLTAVQVRGPGEGDAAVHLYQACSTTSYRLQPTEVQLQRVP
jgi:hypothetical protein